MYARLFKVNATIYVYIAPLLVTNVSQPENNLITKSVFEELHSFSHFVCVIEPIKGTLKAGTGWILRTESQRLRYFVGL